MAKVKIELGGEYTAGQAFMKAQEDVKKFGRDTKDMGEIAKKSLSEIAGNFGEVGKAAGAASGVIAGLAQGGIFGMIASLASTGIGLVVDHFKKAAEEAKKLAQILQEDIANGFSAMKEKMGGVKADAQDAMKEIDALVKTANGKIDNEVKVEVAKLHVETLQKITDKMSEAGQRVVMAQEEMEKETIRYNAQMDKLVAEKEIYLEKQKELSAKEEEAQNLLAEAKKKQADFESSYQHILSERERIQKNANTSIGELVDSGMAQDQAMRYHTSWLKKLAEFDEQHADVVKNATEITKTVSDLEKQQGAITQERSTVDGKLTDVFERMNIAAEEHTAMEFQLADKMRPLAQALDKERIAAENKAVAEAVTAENEMRRDKFQEQIAKKKNLTDQEYNTLMSYLNELIEQTSDDEEVAHALNKKLKETREGLIESEEKLTEANNNNAKEGKKRGAGASAAANVSVNIDRNSINQIPEAPNFPNWRKQQAEQARAERDRLSKLKANTRDVQNWFKGEMPKAYKKQWEKWAITHLTKEDWQYLGDKAIAQQMLSKSEQQRQMGYLEDMKNAIDKALTTR